MSGIEGFDEVSLEIHNLARGRFEATLRAKGQAEVTEPFRPPFGSRATQAMLRRLDPPAAAAGAKGKLRRASRPLPSAQEIGGALFEALFPGRIRRLFDQSRARIDETGPEGACRGLRLRLRLDLEKERMRPLAVLPWELLYDPTSRDFYGRGRLRLLVRHLAAPVPIRPLAVTPPLRVLAVSASPAGLHTLDLEQENHNLRAALAGNDRLRITVLPRATLEATRSALLRDRPHVLHFMGHGGFWSTGEGFLCFEDAKGQTDPVGGEIFSDLLKDFPDVRLVVLNACRTAKMSRVEGHTPYLTVGAALSLAGIPAVTAMQFKISDPGAIRFSQTFYESLAAGDPVDVAVSEGRRALYVLWYRSQSLEWAAPVLFLRSPDGRIFDLPPQAEAPATVEENPGAETGGAGVEISPEEPQTLGIRSLEPLGDRPARTLDLTRHFVGRAIREHALWRSAVLPELKGFLEPALTGGQPLRLDFAAHLSIAFIAGYVLEPKSGLEIALRQRQRKGGFQDWKPDDGPLPDGPHWQAEDDPLLDEGAADVAIAVGLTWPVLSEVLIYIERERLPIRRVLPATLAPEPGHVRNGEHALALAQSLALRIRARTPRELAGTLHLFVAGPNAFQFYLGQLARALGRIQLYEHNFGSGIPGDYTPSILLP